MLFNSLSFSLSLSLCVISIFISERPISCKISNLAIAERLLFCDNYLAIDTCTDIIKF